MFEEKVGLAVKQVGMMQKLDAGHKYITVAGNEKLGKRIQHILVL
jgi:hypothetical protein